jgi:peptide-methionine (S)-S-oxide reductase
VQVTFDPRQVTYGQLLQVFFSGRSRSDATQSAGSRHRDAVSVNDLPANAEQAAVAKAYIAQLDGTKSSRGAS